ncbi:MAG: NAD(P)-dependent glycerol-1-phosphate dehydrogenase [Candidatus Bathyarchaeota archaeon]|nr:NAD(P)-dependent glycerol-1-phosphate dehydrogenase [Candidatus Bathyarchaeota archaeon]
MVERNLQTHFMELPRKVVVGENILPYTGKVCKSLGSFSKTLVVSGSHTWNVAGKVVYDSLVDVGFDVECLVVGKNVDEAVKLVEAKILEFGSDVVFAVGGGRVIDIVKYASFRRGASFVSIPTSASHDGIASPQASLKITGSIASVKTHAPVVIIADVNVILNSPYRLTASGCGDIVAKFTAVRDWILAHNIKNEYYGDYAANLALMSAKLVAKNVELIRENSVNGLRVVVEALISCGVAMSIAGSSRPCSGSEHLFSHALDILTENHAFHGEQCGVGTIMMAYLHRINWRKIRAILKKIGSPVTANELNIEPEVVVKALTLAHTVNPQRYTILGENGLTEEAAKNLAKTTGVI